MAHLLFLNNQGLAGVGGGPSILRHLVAGLTEHRITVVSQDEPGAAPPAVEQVRVRAPQPPGRLWRVAPLHRARALSRGVPAGLLERADLVIAMDVHAAGVAARARRLLYLALSCVPLQERASGASLATALQYAVLERSLARRARAVVVSSAMQAADMRRWTGLRRLRPVVLHPALPGAVLPDPAPRDTVTILAAGRMVPGKGFGTVIELASRLRDLPCRWVLAGDGPSLPGLRDQAAAAGLGERVRFAGSVADLVPLLGASDILVHPSAYESFGMVLFEAMQAGRPVLCGPHVGAAELMPPGFVLDMTELGPLEARLRQLITDRAHRAGTGYLVRSLAGQALARPYLDGFRTSVDAALAV